MSNSSTEPDFPKCTHVLKAKGLANPRTCEVCGLFGPCRSVDGIALLGKATAAPVVSDGRREDDNVNKVVRYNSHPSGIEAIEIVRCLNFNMGNALKYVMRRHSKEYERSLKSAEYYLKDQHRTGHTMVLNYTALPLLERYIDSEPVLEARSFYWSISGYFGAPVDAGYHYMIGCLQKLMESGK